jgi:hypothetical protein
LGEDRDGTLAERIDHAIERHADTYESVKNVVLLTHAQLWRYDILRKNYARNQRGLRKDLEDWLPRRDFPWLHPQAQLHRQQLSGPVSRNFRELWKGRSISICLSRSPI